MIKNKSTTYEFRIVEDEAEPIELRLTLGSDRSLRILIVQSGTIHSGYVPKIREGASAVEWFTYAQPKGLVDLLDPFKYLFSQLSESVTTQHLFQRIEAMQAEGVIEEPRALELTSLAGTAAAYCQSIMQLHVGHDGLMTELFGHNWTTTEAAALTGKSIQYTALVGRVNTVLKALSDDLNQ